MKVLRNVLVVIAAAGAMGSVQAQIPGEVLDLGTLSPTVTTKTKTYASGSFLDTFNFTISAINRYYTGDTESTNISNLKVDLYNSEGRLLHSGLKVQTQLDPGDFYAKISGNVVSDPGTFAFSVSATPEPAEWMLMLLGLLVLGYFARHKIGLGTPAPA